MDARAGRPVPRRPGPRRCRASTSADSPSRRATRHPHLPHPGPGLRHGSRKVRFSVLDADTGQAKDKLVTVRPGSSPIDVPVKVNGDTRFGYDEQYDVVAKAVRGAVIGSYRAGHRGERITAPAVTRDAGHGPGDPGGDIYVAVLLSEPAEVDILQPMRVLAVTEGAELSTKDVDPRWLYGPRR